MTRVCAGILGLWGAAAVLLAGCHPFGAKGRVTDADLLHYQAATLKIEYPDLAGPHDLDAPWTPSPHTIRTEEPEYWDLSLQEAVQIALANSRVMRELGGAVIRAPAAMRTSQDPAIQETDPRFGVDAALSAFDASFASSAFFEKNDRLLNNTFFGGGTRELQQDLAVFQSQIQKQAATGTQFFARSITEYDANNAPGNTFSSAWTQLLETEFRHPLLQGGGIDFNRIAGPGAFPGLPNGVLIARINSDIALADFEIGVRNFVNEVENAYLDLYFAYRDLDARIQARDMALETWRVIRARVEAGRVEADKEAQIREQYYRFEEQVQNALTGRLVEGTQTHLGSPGGSFRGQGGVHVVERRLRLLLGVPISDGRIIRPADEPSAAEIEFDWDEALHESLARRVELRRQKWNVKSRELELVAARNFLLPQLDAIGRYRWRGFGRDLFRQHELTALTVAGERGEDRINAAWDNLIHGDFQEWQLGVELAFPIGFRRAHAGVRNAELRLARERAILREQERQIVHDLSNAIADMKRAYAIVETSYNRREASREQLELVVEAYEADRQILEAVLDAQRRLSDAESDYYRSLIEYSLAVKNVHFEKGSLLDYNDVYLEEGPWPWKAHLDAAEREGRRSEPVDSKLLHQQGWISGGPAPTIYVPHQPGVPLDPAHPEDYKWIEPPPGPMPMLESGGSLPSSPADEAASLPDWPHVSPRPTEPAEFTAAPGPADWPRGSEAAAQRDGSSLARLLSDDGAGGHPAAGRSIPEPD